MAERKRDPEATQRAILRAAEKLFVRRGFAGTSVSDVASAARVTKSLIHHYFGSKRDLWMEVKRLRLAHYAEVQKELLEKSDAAESTLEESIRLLFGYLRRNPELVRLNVWMLLEDPQLSQVMYPDLVPQSIERIRAEQEAGRLRDDVHPRHLIAALISLCTYWFMARHSGLAHLVPDAGTETDDAYLEDLMKIFLRGARPLPRGDAGGEESSAGDRAAPREA